MTTADVFDSDFPSGEGMQFPPLPRPPFDGPEDMRGLPPAFDVPLPEDHAPMGPPPITSWKRFLRVFFGRKVVLVSLIVLVLMILMTIFAPLLAPFGPNVLYTGDSLAQPNAQHWLGTDALGRDTLSRVVYGGRISLVIGITVVLISSVIGIFLGLVAGYYRWARTPIMRVTDALTAFPMILLTMAIAALLGGGIKNVIVALSIGMVPSYIRVMCGMVMQGKEHDYVLALRSVGASHRRVLFTHVFPNTLPPFIVLMTMQLGAVILAEAGLSFLGIGIKPPTAAWGSMINDGRQYLTSNPLLSLAPGLVLMILVYCFNMVGDGLRDALDPRLRGSI
jgi:peptide/nickel transport system permease protein